MQSDKTRWNQSTTRTSRATYDDVTEVPPVPVIESKNQNHQIRIQKANVNVKGK